MLGFDRRRVQDVVKVLVGEEKGIDTDALAGQPGGDAVGRVHKCSATGEANEVAVGGGDAAGVGGDFRHEDGERRERVGHFKPQKAKSVGKTSHEARYSSGPPHESLLLLSRSGRCRSASAIHTSGAR